jgi:hypothetical protein
MSRLRELHSQILVDGEDLKLSEEDVARIQASLGGGPLKCEDVKALVEMRAQARAVFPAFDQLFFPIFKTWLLADGKITLPEQFQLLRMLYGGGGIDQAERSFLQELRRDAKEVSPEFEALYQQAMRD